MAQIEANEIRWRRIWQHALFEATEEPVLAAQMLVGQIGEGEIRGKRMLDIGAGRLVHSKLFRSMGAEVQAVDVALPDGLDNLRKGYSIRVQNYPQIAKYMPKENIYDAVLCTQLLQYMRPEAMRSFLAKMVKVAKPSGHLAVNYVLSGGMIDADNAPIPAFKFAPKSIHAILESEGASIIESTMTTQEVVIEAPGFTEAVPVTVYDLVAQRVA